MLKRDIIWIISALAIAASQQVNAAEVPMPSPKPAIAFANEKGTRLVLLGTAGGPNIRKNRSLPASLLVVDGKPYLIDCGEGTVRQLAQVGFAPHDITRLFLTHLHFDHTAGIGSLLAFNWVSGESQPVHIFGPPGTAALAGSAARSFSIPAELFAPLLSPRAEIGESFQGHDISVSDPKVIYQDEKIKVTAVSNSHFATLKDSRISFGTPLSYSYKIETPTKIIVFTGDTGPSDSVVNLARNADILVSEVFNPAAMNIFLSEKLHVASEKIGPALLRMQQEHLTPEDVGKLAAGANVKMVVLSHIGPGVDEETSYLNYTLGVSKYYKGPVIVGRDLDQF